MSQAPVILPGSPLTGAALVADVNASFAAVISKFSGTTAPTLGPGASSALVEGQWWFDTSVTPNVLRIHDGGQFVPVAWLDTVAHVFNVPGTWRNILSDNGGMEVWQRAAGSSATFAINASTAGFYTADRWYITTGANEASVVAAVTGLTNPSNLAAKVTRNSAQTGTAAYIFGFPLDTDEIFRLRGQKVAISAVVKSGANWSPASGTLSLAFYTGTGAVGKRAAGFTGETNVVTTTINLAISTQGTMAAASTVTVPTTSTQAEIQFTWTPVGTAGADDSITLDDVQLEIGTFASQFERIPFEKALLGCKRHYWKSFVYGTAPAQNVGISTGELFGYAGKAGATAGEFILARNPVSMRATPGTVTLFNPAAANAQVRDETLPGDCSASSVNSSSTEHINITATGSAAGTTTAVGNILGVHVTVDAGI